MATIRDVAKLAGVSVATVSRVINQNGYVTKDTEQKVRKVIELLHYEPNAVARGLAGKQTGTIAFILPDISNPFFPEVARAVEDVAQAHGYTVILCNSDDEGHKERSYIEVLKKKYIDGIIFASNTMGQEDMQKLYHIDDLPVVALDRAPTNQTCSVIRSKNYAGAQMAVNHLLSIGCRKIAHIYGPPQFVTARERLAGYQELVKKFPWYSPDLMVPGNFHLDGGMKAAEQLLRAHPDVDGIFAGNDLMALGALKTMSRLGIRVPEQISICGFDGIALTAVTEPELTTIAQPIYEMGATAARVLIEKIQGNDTNAQEYELEVELVERGTTRKKVT
ncbi:LacI family DNA-binding transcriptional regulator [Brevibacillus fulvus]|uniref:LacI family DNA-binding transcriptional regulator n=1 Tax=Brevibacillus fulvus TaxID=1125967 RepID=UPI00195AAED7|nr:LacI family DNA-binding transcriptional regulator [Brevibacillus fulvus]